mmetsp:Transcript_16591/g.29376  ORF Transcript_16591/g.29376 Transcript_16591/m.29376 type:complete len:568 (+) Transcript_16591:93-1796(+)|eukprot:CAMPEP_0184514734 /NCGR_PEP_ID=MMETSP0198_2-20121128/4121_1 /TAXON_ID=1112570 /ORGANISM="Thraustochytrium sp., Strain LLF1b" /LENGTH=567 /DNA_ID=CAMNT_0026904943 /DNA_START=40 /DNA_END=1743 /DNA_ORIENTATION=+
MDGFTTLGDANFTSRRSAVYARQGMVASSQPYATEIGLQVLRKGGNAIDAAIAVAAGLQVTEPCSTGLGGDCFLLYYEAKSKEVYALNGSGRAPSGLTLEKAKAALREQGLDPSKMDALPADNVHCVTVPGTAAGWADAVDRWGTWSLADVLEPAATLAEDGFPLHQLTALQWERGLRQLKRGPNWRELTIGEDNHTPRAGEVFHNPGLAKTLRELGEGGKEAFYGGRAGEEIVKVLNDLGSFITMEDLEAHKTTFPEPIRVPYRDYEVLEVPPNGQGIAALIALNILEDANKHGPGLGPDHVKHLSTEHLHTLIEAMRLGFADARAYVADEDVVDVPTKGLLDPAYAAERRKLINPKKASVDAKAGSPQYGSDTVSFQVVDVDGNAVSMVNSNYEGFGSGIIPKGCGFTMQNRGGNFSLTKNHPNVLAPNKRPYHTIIPALMLHRDTQDLYATFTNMGGFMQPPGHVNLVVNMVDYHMDPQAAIDAPRFCIADGTGNGEISLEDGVDEEVVAELIKMGHKIANGGKPLKGLQRMLFGRSQIIVRDRETGVLCAGSDGRADGMAVGF